jgi:hypothetical protein
MRLTVGPLPAAVYWRRRLFVLGGVLLLIIGFWTSCGGPRSGRDNRGALQTPISESPSPSDSPTGQLLVPTIDESQSASPSPSDSPPPVIDGETCTDGELSLTPAAIPNPTKVAATTTLTFVIKNISQRTCVRDVGGLPQELRIMQGTTLIWSSDHCKPAGKSVVRTFKPNESVTATVYWDGRKTVRDGKVDCTRPAPVDMRAPAGTYQLVGRLDNAYSQAVSLQVTS